MNISLWYWRTFNFVLRRVVAIAFAVGGLIVAASYVPGLLPGGTVSVNGEPSADTPFRLLGVGLPLLVAMLGVLLFRSKPYYPADAPQSHHDI